MPRVSFFARLHVPAAACLVALIATSSLFGEPRPHPDRPDRLVDERGGVSVEYSPEDEPWAAALLEATAAKNVGIEARLTAHASSASSLPGSAADLRVRRDIFLAAIARQIGIDEPTELQARTFDTFLGYYDIQTVMMADGAARIIRAAKQRTHAIWRRDDLVRRLRDGERIPGFSYNPATDTGSFQSNSQYTLPRELVAALKTEIDAQRLDHDYSYDIQDGTTTVAASIRLRRPTKPLSIPAQTADDSPTPEIRLDFPLILKADRLARAPSAVVGEFLESYETMMADALAQAVRYRAPEVAYILFHETAEIGLVERRIASRDRRWLCDGTANYVAWRVARDLVDADFAKQCYDLDDQLRRYAVQQPHIALADWPAVEKQDRALRDTDLNRAHYAYATRAMFLLAEKHGDDALASLWREVGKTPLREADSRTFAAAYRKLTGDELPALIRSAEQTPLPTAP